LKDFEKSVTNFKCAIALDSSKIGPYLGISRIYYEEIGDFTVAK